jgi:ubiquinone/menaquinone biosynthesis C-methylase UbiE
VSFYERTILPRLIHAGMRQERFRPYRQRLVSAADGRVLEIGFGSGLNLPMYSGPTLLIGLDPSARALSIARLAVGQARYPVQMLEGSAEAIPLENQSIDTVVAAWTLCSIPDVPRALREVRRVLTPAGRFLFVEHGRSPDADVAAWQQRLTPFWKRIAGGCHLNRPVGTLVEQAGFRIERMHTGYMSGPRPLTFMYEGCARPA